VTSPSQRPLHNIETQQANIHAPSGIQTRDPSNQAAADLRLRPRGHRGRLCDSIQRSNSMEQRHESLIFVRSINVHRHSINPKIHYRIHKGLPLVRVFNYMNPLQLHTPYFSKTYILSHLSLYLLSGLFPFRFYTKALH
jgi:hypothetical protein